MKITIILPARNEAASLSNLLPAIRENFPDAEIIVVNDGSDDNTEDVCIENNVKVINHPYPKGNGAAIKSGARVATGNVLVFMDADGQHQPGDMAKLIAKLEEGFDMVVGERSVKSHASFARRIANSVYNRFSSWMVGSKVRDLTSGFRVVYTDKFREFLYLLPNGFSYPTTITMSFFRAGYSVAYVPIDIKQRIGDSHIKPITDGLKFFLIIFKVSTLYTPLKLFTPISLLFFVTGIGHYIFTFITQNRFTNMSTLLLITSILVFLIGLLSEQLTVLMYRDKK